MTGKSRRWRAAVIAGVLLASGCTAGDETATPPPLTIGVLAPLSGPDAARGREAVQGAELAVDMVNNPRFDLSLPYAGSIGIRNGSRLALVTGDTRAEPTAPDRMARVQGALGLVVSDRSETVRALSERAERLQLPVIDAATTDDSLSELGRRCYFRIVPTDRDLASAVFGLLRQQRATGLPVRRVPVGGGQSDGFESVLAAFREAAASAGNDLSTLRYRDQPTEIDGLVSQITGTGTELVVAMTGSDAEARAAGLLADRLKDRMPVIAIGRSAGALDAGGPGLNALRTVGWSTQYPTRSPTAKTLAETYRSRYGTAMTEPAVMAFTATLTLVRAIDVAQRPGTAEVRAALRRVWFARSERVLPWNGIRFDASGRN